VKDQARAADGSSVRDGRAHAPLIQRARHFVSDEIWRPDEEVAGLRMGGRILRRVARILYCTVQAFTTQRRSFNAAALTYFSALSIVPFLAFSFSLVKGLGGYRALVHDVIRPWISSTFPGNQPIQKALDQLLAFVEHTNLTTLGAVGLITLTYGAISLLSSVEQAFNEIWGVTRSRPLLRRTTNYVTLLVLTPVLAIVAASLTTAAESSTLMAHFEALPVIGHAVRAAFRLSSLAIVMIAFGALYVIMPNTHVRISAAAVGAFVASLLWQLALILQVNSQRAIASYSALYSGFSAIPIFFVWMYVSWTIVLAGAELASSTQHEAAIRQRRRARDADQAFRERVALQVMAEVAEAFLRHAPRYTAECLAGEVRSPIQVTNDVIADLVRADLLLLVGERESQQLALGADVDQVRATDILHACRHRTHAPGDPTNLEAELLAPVATVADALDAEAARSAQNLSLRELADLAHAPARATAHEPSELRH
jgi:membrane protein